MLEVNIGPFLAAMGAAGFTIGFALQGTLSNFAAGIMILLYRPYDLGDKVTVAGTTGVVASMTLVSTVLTNDDKHMITIPNSATWGGTISNQTPGPATAASAAAQKQSAPCPETWGNGLPAGLSPDCRGFGDPVAQGFRCTRHCAETQAGHRTRQVRCPACFVFPRTSCPRASTADTAVAHDAAAHRRCRDHS